MQEILIIAFGSVGFDSTIIGHIRDGIVDHLMNVEGWSSTYILDQLGVDTFEHEGKILIWEGEVAWERDLGSEFNGELREPMMDEWNMLIEHSQVENDPDLPDDNDFEDSEYYGS